MSGAFEQAWSVLKALNPAFQDDPNAPEQDLRHYQNMQSMLDTYTPRGNTNPRWLQPAGHKPLTPFPQGFVDLNPWMEAANLEHQAKTSRNPADARMFAQQAIEARNSPVAVEDPEGSLPEAIPWEQGIDMEEIQRYLAEAHRRSIAPLSYRRKIKPLSDEEVARDLRRLRDYRR